MKTQIQRIVTPDPNVRAYFSRCELTKTAVLLERGVPQECECEVTDCPVAEEILVIPGVVMVGVKPYSLTVIKAPTFDWEEIEPSLLRFLTSFNLTGAAFEEEVLS